MPTACPSAGSRRCRPTCRTVRRLQPISARSRCGGGYTDTLVPTHRACNPRSIRVPGLGDTTGPRDPALPHVIRNRALSAAAALPFARQCGRQGRGRGFGRYRRFPAGGPSRHRLERVREWEMGRQSARDCTPRIARQAAEPPGRSFASRASRERPWTCLRMHEGSDPAPHPAGTTPGSRGSCPSPRYAAKVKRQLGASPRSQHSVTS